MFLEPGFAAEAVAGGAGEFEFGSGAIAGAAVASVAFLAGLAALRGGAAAFSALVVVLGAGFMTAISLGIAPALSPQLMDIFASVLAAAVLVFLAATIRTARVNPVLGGVMFVSALGLVGLSIASAAMQGELAGYFRFGLMGVAGFAAIIAGFEAVRGDRAAALLLPGFAAAGVALLFPAFIIEATGFALAPQAIFMAGVIASSLTALTDARPHALAAAGMAAGADASQHVEPNMRRLDPQPEPFEPASFEHASFEPGPEAQAQAGDEHSRAEALRVSENQLAEVLDYAGLAVWDWSPRKSHHTEGFAAMVGAGPGEILSPQAFAALVSRRDRGRFESGVLGGGDGPFDEALHLQNGSVVRLRGARAVRADGDIDRFIAFAEVTKPERHCHPEPAREQKLLEHKKSGADDGARAPEIAASSQLDSPRGEEPRPDPALARAAVSLSQTAAAVSREGAASAVRSAEVDAGAAIRPADAAARDEKPAAANPAAALAAASTKSDPARDASAAGGFSKPAALLEIEAIRGGDSGDSKDASASDAGGVGHPKPELEIAVAGPAAARNLRDDRPSSRLFRQRPFGRGLR